MSELESGHFIKHEYCIGTEIEGKNDCDSSDGLAIYESDEGESVGYTGFCWVCKQFMSQKDLANSTLASDLGLSAEGIVTERKKFERKSKQPALTKPEVKEMISELTYDNKGYRGIKKEYAQFFGHLTQLNHKGEVSATYYPETRDGGAWPTGYKIRYHPKSFGKVGQTGLASDMAGYIKFKDYTGHRDVLIVGGECFTKDTQVMTQKGWVSIEDVVLSKDYQVMQVLPSGEGELVTPLAYINKHFSGELVHYENKYLSSLTTPKHNLVAKDSRGFYKFPAEQGVRSAPHKTPVCTDSIAGSGVSLSDSQLALIIAVAADSKLDIYPDGTRKVHFGLKKERKKERLKRLLEVLEIPYTSYPQKREGYDSFNFKLPFWFEGKGLPANWLHTLSKEQRLFVLKELTYWDGNFVKGRKSTEFSSKLYSEAGLVRDLAKLSGMHASIRKRQNELGTWYAVKISWVKSYTTWQSLKESKKVSYDGKVYCVTVPSGMLLVKHNEKVSVSGNCDMVSAFQMLRDNQIRKGQEDYAPVAVVSPTTGEGSAVAQVRRHYEWLCGFETIVLGLDNDEAGLAAMEEIAKILPREKIKIAHWTGKDPNNMLQKGDNRQFLSDWYNAKVYVKNGIITSGDADLEIEAELMRPKMSLPSFMKGLQKKMAGGVPLGYIVNWIAESGVGKSTLVNEVIRHWIFNSQYKVGILSLELTAAQYMIAMLSREVGHKINLIEDPEEAVKFVQRPDVMEARRHLSFTEDGDSRFVILDERDGELSEVKRQCETLVNKYGCQILVIDPVQDLFEGVDMDQQNSFLKWMKGMLKRGVTFSNVCHVKKSGGSSTDKEGRRIIRELSEDDVHGISAIVKSAGANLFMSRNKYEDSEVAKNTTYPTLGKCRWSGNTGKIAPWYYSNTKHTMYDLLEYFEENPEELPEGYDLGYSPFDRKSQESQGFDFKKKQKQVKEEKDFMEDSIF